MMTLSWPWPFLGQGQIWYLRLFYSQKLKTVDFPEFFHKLLKPVTWKSVDADNYLSLWRYGRSRSFLDPGRIYMQPIYLAIFEALYRHHSQSKKGLYFPNLCILGIIFSKSRKNFPKCKGKGSFPKSQMMMVIWSRWLLRPYNLW